MNAKTYVKISNVIGLVSIILLVLWVFSFILIEVFDLLIFKKNMTETFMMSILALIAVLAGSLFVNVMFNLTRIADKHNADETKKISTKAVVAVITVFPLVAAILFTGNYFTEQKKERFMLESTKNYIEKSKTTKALLKDVKFNEEWVDELARELKVFKTSELNFDNPSVILYLNLDGEEKYYQVHNYNTYRYNELQDTIPIYLHRYEEHFNRFDTEYYEQVFKNGSKENRFIRDGKNFILEYPYTYDSTTVIIHTSDYQNYGKFGS